MAGTRLRASQVLYQVPRDAQHLALYPPLEALHHAIRAGRVGPRRAMLHPELLAGRLEPISREARSAVGQHMGDLEGKGPDGLRQESHGTALGLIVLNGQVHEAGRPVDGDIQVALAARYRLRLWPSWVRSLGRCFT